MWLYRFDFLLKIGVHKRMTTIMIMTRDLRTKNCDASIRASLARRYDHSSISALRLAINTYVFEIQAKQIAGKLDMDSLEILHSYWIDIGSIGHRLDRGYGPR